MSSAGHVLDMIARMKNNRAQRKSQKGKFKGHLEGKYDSVSNSNGLKFKEVDGETYEEWKQNFLAEKKAYRSKMTKRIILLIVLVGFLAFFVRLWAKDELQFLFSKTEFTSAEIYEVERFQVERGYYLRRLHYQFNYDGRLYTGSFVNKDASYEYSEGDLVKVKYATSHPKRSKFESRLKRIE